MSLYLTCMCAGALVSWALFALRCKKRTGGWKTALIALPLMPLFALVLAKVCYVLCFFEMQTVRYGVGAFWQMQPRLMSIVGASAGVCLAATLSARLSRQRAAKVLDALAPAGALMLAVARACEVWQGSLGYGEPLPEDSPLGWMPIAIAREGEWFYAVFVWEALAALVVAVVFLLRKDDRVPGLSFELAASFVCAAQILAENVRVSCMRWGFVRIEQVACAVILFAFVERSCRLQRGKSFKRWLPLPLFLLCAGVVIMMEFALDKWDLDNTICYAIMILAVAGMAALELYAAHRRRLFTKA